MLSLEAFYEMVMKIIPLPCYLVYLKLKVHYHLPYFPFSYDSSQSLDYIVVRHRKQIALFHDEADLLRRMKGVSERSLLDEAASFDVFRNEASWTKSKSIDIAPVGRVVVT